MSWSGGNPPSNALWNGGGGQYVTARQLQSTISSFAFLSSNVIDISGKEVTGVTLLQVSSAGFKFSPSLSVDLGLGNALGGALAGLGAAVGGAFAGIGAGAGYAVYGLTTGVAGLFTPRNQNFINSTNFETVNGTTQLQFSTLGSKGDGNVYSTIFRTTNSATPQNAFGAEIFQSSFFTGGTKVARSVGDPLQIASASTLNSSIQAFGQWVPILDTDEKLNAQTLRADYSFANDSAGGLLISSGTAATYSTILSTTTLSSYSKAQTWINNSQFNFINGAVLPVPVSPITITGPISPTASTGSWFVGMTPGTNNIWKVILPSARNYNFFLYGSTDGVNLFFPTVVTIGGTFPKNPVTASTYFIPFGSVVNVAWTTSTATINNLITPPVQESTVATAITALVTDSFETVLTTNNQYSYTYANPYPTSSFSSSYSIELSGNFISTGTDYLSTVGSTLAWTAPIDISGDVVIRLYGGGGGRVAYPNGPYFANVDAGAGGFVGGNLALAPGSTVYFTVGEAGSPGMAGHPDGGMPASSGGGGGGSTRLYADSAQSTILMVAGGGGGQGQVGAGSGAGQTEGGAGGGDPAFNFLGGNADVSYGGGYGGDNTTGGGTSYDYGGTAGSFLLGGAGGTFDGREGGGGGGYYGGGGGSANSGGGWGGGGGGGYADSTMTTVTGLQGGANNPAANGWVAIDYGIPVSTITSTITSSFTSTIGEYASTFTAFDNLAGNLALQASTFALGPLATTRTNKFPIELYGDTHVPNLRADSTITSYSMSSVINEAIAFAGITINTDAGYISDLYGSTLWFEDASISSLNVAYLNAGVLVVSTTTETSFSTQTAALDEATISTLLATNAYISSLQVYNGNFNLLSASTLTLSSGTVVNNASFSSINTDLLTFSTGTCVTNLNFSTIQSNGTAIPLFDISKTTTLLSSNYNACSSITNDILNYTMNIQCNDQTTTVFGDNQQDFYTMTAGNQTQWASTLLQFNGENSPGIINMVLPFAGISTCTFDFQRTLSPRGYASQALYLVSDNYPGTNGTQYYQITDVGDYGIRRVLVTTANTTPVVTVTTNPVPYTTQNTNVFQIRQDINDTYISTTDRLYIQAGDTLISNQVNVPLLVTSTANVTNGQFDNITTNSTNINISYTNVANVNVLNATTENVSTSLIQNLGAAAAFTSSLVTQTLSTVNYVSTNSFIAPAPNYNLTTYTNPLFKRYQGDFTLQNQGNVAFNDILKQDTVWGQYPGWVSSIDYLVGAGQSNQLVILDGGVVNGKFDSFQPYDWRSSMLTCTWNSSFYNSVILNNCPSLTAGAEFKIIAGGTASNDFQVQFPGGSTSPGYGSTPPICYTFNWSGSAWNFNATGVPYNPSTQKGTVEIQTYPGSNAVNLSGSGVGGNANFVLNGIGMVMFSQTFSASVVNSGGNGSAALTANVSPDGGTTTYSINQYQCMASIQYFVPGTTSFAINAFQCYPQSSGGPNPVWQINSVFLFNAIAGADRDLSWQMNILLIPRGYFLNYL